MTGNEGKVREAREYLDADVEQVAYDYVEVQSDDVGVVAARGARDALAALGDGPVVVEDSGLFVDALGGFPGPYSSYVEDRLGIERVWHLAEPEADRRARFRSVVACAWYPDGSLGDTTSDSDDVRVETFAGSVRGRIVAPRGDGGFGFDPIFEHDGTTFAEMSTERKNALSHRGRALAKFAEWSAERESWR